MAATGDASRAGESNIRLSACPEKSRSTLPETKSLNHLYCLFLRKCQVFRKI
jgi:hypothetical protein